MSLVKKMLSKVVSMITAVVVSCCIVSSSVTVSAGETPDFKKMAEEIVVLVNKARTEAGLNPLYMVPYLNDIANTRARECINDFSHFRPNGELFIDALDTNVIDYFSAAENIAAGCSTSEGTFNQWKNSEGHWKSIMNPNYTHIGVGVSYEQNSTYKWYWEQFFIESDDIVSGQYLPQICNGEIPDFSAMAYEIAVLVNEARMAEGVKPVYVVPYLNDVANIRAYECVGNFGHIRPNGQKFIDVVDTNIVNYYSAAENIAAGCSTAEATFNQWKNSESHWKSIMNPEYTHLGVGVYYDSNSTYKWYWEQLFISNEKNINGQYVPERYKTVPVSKGDINGDANVDIFDYILLVKYKTSGAVLNDLQLDSADCMHDGEITIADCIILKKYVMGMYSNLPVYP